MNNFTSLENTALEIEGISYMIDALADQIRQNKGGLAPDALEIAFISIENHLLRISKSIEQAGMNSAG